MYALMIFGWFGSVAEVLYALYCSLRAKFFQDESLLFWLTAMALFGIAEHKLLVVGRSNVRVERCVCRLARDRHCHG